MVRDTITARVILCLMVTLEPDVYLSMGLSDLEFHEICRLLGRTPTYTELGMFSVQWSEHCSYKCSRPVLAYFKKYKEAIEGEGLENAGIVDIGDGLGIAMKVESHNHPSAVEPYQGAATGVGGIIRDIFTMGARPIAMLNSLRFGPIESADLEPAIVARNHYLFEHVVAGIGGYGNCVGVPTVAGEVTFHPRYSGNPLVNAMCVGLLPIAEATTSSAEGSGNPVIYLGSATGRDGIHGASFASANLDEDSAEKRPNVQIGDPFAEKLLIEATLEALKTGAIQSIQDMGAAGLTCSTTEMASKGGVGMEINLDLVPMREGDMSAYELMLSESQERMLCVAFLGREHEVIQVFEKWGLNAVVIGNVTDSGRVRVSRNGIQEVDVNASDLTDGCPVVNLLAQEPQYYRDALAFDISPIPDSEHEMALLKLLSHPSLASKNWIFRQYDQQVQTQTTLTCGEGDAAVLAPRGTQKGLALKIDGNSLWVYLDPYTGGQLAVAEAARNVACTGARPVAATDGLNFGNPKQPHVFWQFERSVKGIADACEAMNTPIVSGNVSFYNESELGEVLPTPLIGMCGLMKDASKRVGSAFLEPGVDIVLLWYKREVSVQQGIGASAYLSICHSKETGIPEKPIMSREREQCEFLAELAEEGLVTNMHDVSEGGLAFALAEMCMGQNIGCSVSIDDLSCFGHRMDSKLFGEFPGLVLMGTRNITRLSKRLPQGFEAMSIGMTTNDNRFKIEVNGDELINLNLAEMMGRYMNSIRDIMQE